MKYNNKIRHFSLLCLLSGALCGCTDWNDHYNDTQNVIANYTLWEEIESRPELTDFKECLERYGYKEILDGSQMYTVFAPKGTIDTVGLSEEKIKKEVIENHIARFTYSANSAVDKKPTVTMLNAKSINFVRSAGGYMFGNNRLAAEDCNIRAKNGVLHVIEGQQKFSPNIWEYLTTDERFEKIRSYLYSFNDTILDENKSIKGEINEDGQQEYLDSVVYIYNQLHYSIGQLSNEDSTYTMIIPTNEAWDEAYKRIKKYYQYPISIAVAQRDSLVEYYTSLSVVRDLVFSHTVQQSVNDSLVSTSKGVFQRPFEYILSEYADWNEATPCSNGGVFVVEKLQHKPWDSWHRRIKLEAENSNALHQISEGSSDEITSGALTYRRTLPDTDTLYTKVSNGSYLEVRPISSIQLPYLVFNIWNTLAGKYEVKVVFLPQNKATYKGEIRPNMFKAYYRYINRDGNWVSKDMFTYTENYNPIYEFVNNPLSVDTVSLGTVNLSYCRYGTEKSAFKLVMECPVADENYSTTFLIDCIILEPVKE